MAYKEVELGSESLKYVSEFQCVIKMRFNDRELMKAAEGSVTIEGILQYMKPRQGGDWSDWYLHPVFKERIFKLISNLLFYYRTNDLEEPMGMIVMENVQVAYENTGAAFAFSLRFSDGKHVFACRCQDDVNKWVSALKMASYEYWRSLHGILQAKINMIKGRDPNYTREQEQQNKDSIITRMSKSTFYSHSSEKASVVVENLIDLS